MPQHVLVPLAALVGEPHEVVEPIQPVFVALPRLPLLVHYLGRLAPLDLVGEQHSGKPRKNLGSPAPPYAELHVGDLLAASVRYGDGEAGGLGTVDETAVAQLCQGDALL